MIRAFRLLSSGALLAALLFAVSAATFSAPRAKADGPRPLCQENAVFCTEVMDSLQYEGHYTGHDEPSLLFYSDKPGSGNNNLYRMRLPKDPPTLPKQDGTGGTFNFQLHPAFWFGMALCDSQSAPNPGKPCTADSDGNIFDGSNPNAADYIGKHPGTAFMELQFYPPGWAPAPFSNGCDALKWCAAMAIFSLSENMNTGQDLNPTCQAVTGLEYANYAFITRNGVPHAPANPVDSTLATFTPDPTKDLFMNSGDELRVSLRDTSHGLQVVIRDLTTGQNGSMTASADNTFGQVKFAPPPSTECTNIPYNFHPMYATSSEHTRVPWAAHSYNVAFSDEIGHFEYCNAISGEGGSCTQDGVGDKDTALHGVEDDVACFSAAFSMRIRITGCQGTDVDFDGVPYQTTWPGSLTNVSKDRSLNPSSVLFSSPLFRPSGERDDRQSDERRNNDSGQLTNYSRVAFEADLPRIENFTNPPCQRHVSNPADPDPGKDCVNPPKGANFYPIFTTRGDEGNCLWQLGGTHIPGTTNTFGGTSTAEYGPLLLLAYPAAGNVPTFRYNDFRRVLGGNPCRSDSGDSNMTDSGQGH